MDKKALEYAKQLPLLFAQVREDPRIDLDIVHSLGRNHLNVLMIGSGGCTLAPLACEREWIKTIDVVGSNLSQLYLCQLKLFLMAKSPKERAQILGHLPMENRLKVLKEICEKLSIPVSAFGDEENLDRYGPDYLGRYEWLFKSFSEAFKKTSLASKLLNTSSIEGQRVLLEDSLSELHSLFESHFSLEKLIDLFGEEAVQNKRTSYANHFFERFQWTMRHQKIHENPYFYQFAFWSNPKTSQNLYLSLPASNLTEIAYHHTSMLEFLDQALSSSYDYVHLSNILDWLDPTGMEDVLQQVKRVLKPMGKCCIRQLNSLVEIESFQGLSFETLENQPLAQCDLSFFYPKIYIGEKV